MGLALNLSKELIHLATLQVRKVQGGIFFVPKGFDNGRGANENAPKPQKSD